jgi:hypothetical protein
MKTKFGLAMTVALVLSLLITTIVLAAWWVDGEGFGFVGKGDVQLVYGWNNKALQDNADLVQFQAASVVVTEVSWICTNSKNEQTQERERTTTTTLEGLLESVARDKKQVTGFMLNGWDGEHVSLTETEGPPLNSCPEGPWTLTTPAGDPEVVSESGGGLQVSFDGGDWYDLPAPE